MADIVVCYRELMDEALKKQRVQVKTAFPLSTELSERLRKGLEGLTGKQVEMTVEEDPSLAWRALSSRLGIPFMMEASKLN